MNPLRQLAVGFHNLAQTGASNGSPPMTISALADACDPLLNMINIINQLMNTTSTESWGKEIIEKVSFHVESSPLIWEFLEHIYNNMCAKKFL